MKTNFYFINELLEQTKPKARRTLRILHSTINELELALHERKHSQTKLPFRYYSEILTQFIYEVIYYSMDDEFYKSISKKWKKEAKYKDKKHYSIHSLSDALFDLGLISKEDSKLIKGFYSSINHIVHIINQESPIKKINAFVTNDVYSIHPTSYDEYVNKLRKLHKTLVIILNSVFKNLDDNILIDSFDEELYSDGRLSFKASTKGIELSKMANTDCLICNEGIIGFSKNSKYENGPFLECDNPKCGAYMSINLNLKSKEVVSNCKVCVEENYGEGKIKKTISYDNSSEYYNKIVNQCNLCKEIKN